PGILPCLELPSVDRLLVLLALEQLLQNAPGTTEVVPCLLTILGPDIQRCRAGASESRSGQGILKGLLTESCLIAPFSSELATLGGVVACQRAQTTLCARQGCETVIQGLPSRLGGEFGGDVSEILLPL